MISRSPDEQENRQSFFSHLCLPRPSHNSKMESTHSSDCKKPEDQLKQEYDEFFEKRKERKDNLFETVNKAGNVTFGIGVASSALAYFFARNLDEWPIFLIFGVFFRVLGTCTLAIVPHQSDFIQYLVTRETHPFMSYGTIVISIFVAIMEFLLFWENNLALAVICVVIALIPIYVSAQMIQKKITYQMIVLWCMLVLIVVNTIIAINAAFLIEGNYYNFIKAGVSFLLAFVLICELLRDWLNGLYSKEIHSAIKFWGSIACLRALFLQAYFSLLGNTIAMIQFLHTRDASFAYVLMVSLEVIPLIILSVYGPDKCCAYILRYFEFHYKNRQKDGRLLASLVAKSNLKKEGDTVWFARKNIIESREIEPNLSGNEARIVSLESTVGTLSRDVARLTLSSSRSTLPLGPLNRIEEDPRLKKIEGIVKSLTVNEVEKNIRTYVVNINFNADKNFIMSVDQNTDNDLLHWEYWLYTYFDHEIVETHPGSWENCGGNLEGFANCQGDGKCRKTEKQAIEGGAANCKNCGAKKGKEGEKEEDCKCYEDCKDCGAGTHWTCCFSTDKSSIFCTGRITHKQAIRNHRLLSRKAEGLTKVSEILKKNEEDRKGNNSKRGKVVGVQTLRCNPKLEGEVKELTIEIEYNFTDEYMIGWANENMRRLKWENFYCHLLSMSPRDLKTIEEKKNAFTFSEKVEVGHDTIDFFISHSWEDDGVRKYLELTKFVEKFASTHNGRYPTFWLDKVCMDQVDTSAAVTFLPINIGACKRMLVFLSKTYFTRLWCIWELFILFTFCQESLMFERVRFLQIDQTDPIAELRNFKLAGATCFGKEEEVSLREVIETIGGESKLKEVFNKLADFLETQKNQGWKIHILYLPQHPALNYKKLLSRFGCEKQELDRESVKDNESHSLFHRGDQISGGGCRDRIGSGGIQLNAGEFE
jgi:hypothetical protein